MKMFFLAAVLVAAGGMLAFSDAAPAAMNAFSPYSCTDTDKGKNPNKLGAIKLYNSLTRRSAIITDTCASENYVMEGYCDQKKKNSYGQVQMKCSNGTCQRGVCVPDKPTTPKPATFNLHKDPSSVPTSVLPGTSGVVLARYNVELTGGTLALGEIALGFVTNSPAMLSGTVLIKVDGANVAAVSPAMIRNSATQLTSVILSSYPTLVAGNHVITLEGNISSGAANGSVVTTYLDIIKVRKSTPSITYYDPNVTVVASDPVTVQSGALAVITGGPGGEQVTVGTSNVKLATIRLSAGPVSSGEDVKITSLTISNTISYGSNYTDIGNLVLYDENGAPLATTASTATGSSNTTFTFANPLVVSKIGERVLVLKGDALAGSGNHNFAIKKSSDIVAAGKDSGNTIIPIINSASGTIVKVAPSGGVLLSLVSDHTASPSADQLISLETNDVALFGFSLKSDIEPAKLRSLRLTISGVVSTTFDISNIRLYRNGETTPFASAQSFTQAGNVLVFNWTATDNILQTDIQPGAPVTITAKANIGGRGQAVLGNSLRFGIANAQDIQVVGTNSATNLTVSGAPVHAAGLTTIVPFNVTATAETPSAGSAMTQAIITGTPLAIVKIQNNGDKQITLRRVNFTDSGYHTGNTTAYSLKYSDQGSLNLANTAYSSLVNSTNFSLNGAENIITIDGGFSRYLGVSITNIGTAQTGDSWQYSFASLGDIQYLVQESDLGYDANGDNTLNGDSGLIPVDGKPLFGKRIKS